MHKIVPIFAIVLLLIIPLELILVIFKLVNILHWSWLWITSPFWITSTSAFIAFWIMISFYYRTSANEKIMKHLLLLFMFVSIQSYCQTKQSNITIDNKTYSVHSLSNRYGYNDYNIISSSPLVVPSPSSVHQPYVSTESSAYVTEGYTKEDIHADSLVLNGFCYRWVMIHFNGKLPSPFLPAYAIERKRVSDLYKETSLIGPAYTDAIIKSIEKRE